MSSGPDSTIASSTRLKVRKKRSLNRLLRVGEVAVPVAVGLATFSSRRFSLISFSTT
jgi:hypothetical protein